jgi:hypothetical protein
MKRLLFPILVAFLFVSKGNAQVKGEKTNKNKADSSVSVSNNKVKDDTTIYISAVVDVQPEFIGGMPKWYSFLQENFKAPDVPGLNGKVIISFVVEKDGSLVDIKVLRDVGYGTGDEAIRIMKLSPNWTPAQQNGATVRCSFVQTISIAIPATAVEPISETKATDDNALYNSDYIEIQPSFPGGEQAWDDFLKKNYTPIFKIAFNAELLISFIVEKDGSLTDIKIVKDYGLGTGEDAVRVMGRSPKWEPGKHKGAVVRCLYFQKFPTKTQYSNRY